MKSLLLSLFVLCLFGCDKDEPLVPGESPADPTIIPKAGPVGQTYANVTIRSVTTGNYLSTEDGERSMRINREWSRQWENFTVTDLGNRQIALRGSNGSYVSSENGERPMTCSANERRSWEVFTLEFLGNDQYALRGNNGRYVGRTSSDYTLWCTSPAIDEAERFTVSGLPTTPFGTNSLQLIIDDMNLPHQGYPAGVPEWTGWSFNPRIGEGNEPPELDWEAMTAWGQVYLDRGATIKDNVRFQLRNMQSWYLSKSDGRWRELQSTDLGIDGRNYVVDFVGDENETADNRDESQSGGGISSTVIPGHNFHYWPDRRALIPATDIAGIWVAVEGRLILDDPRGPDNRAASDLIMNIGGDYWKYLDGAFSNFETNRDFTQGRFRRLTGKWQTFNGHTLTDEQLRNNPPPFE